MNEHDLDFLIADAMTKVDALLARGAHYDNIAIVVTPSIYYRLARRSDYQWCENIRIDGNGYYGRYHGFNIYIVENAPEADMCFPAFYYETNDTLIPIHPGEYLIFGNNEELYQTDDGVAIRDSGMNVSREVTHHAVDAASTAAATAATATRNAFAAQIDARLSEELLRAIREAPLYSTAETAANTAYSAATTTTDTWWARSPEWEPTYMSSWFRDIGFTRPSFKKPKAKVQKPEPELQPTPELDEFIEQFRRSN